MAALQFDRGRPFPSQLLALPRESPDVTAVERDAAKLGQPCAAVAGRPSKNSLPLRGRGTPLRANSFQTGRVPKKVNVASSFSPSPGALVSRPGAADPRAGSGSQFPAVLRVESKFMFAFSSVWAAVSRGAEPRSRRCRYPGATDGQHGRCRAKGCPQIGSQHMRQGYTHPLQGLLRRWLWPERATQHFVSARVLRRVRRRYIR